MNSDEHISQDALEQYAMETLPKSKIAPLERHLIGCEACQDRLGHLNQFMADLLKVARETIGEVPSEEG